MHELTQLVYSKKEVRASECNVLELPRGYNMMRDQVRECHHEKSISYRGNTWCKVGRVVFHFVTSDELHGIYIYILWKNNL